MFTKAIVRPPGPTFASGITTSGLGEPDLARALSQHATYVKALEDCGLSVTRLEPDPRFPDSTFVEDAAVFLPGLAVLTRPGAPSRQGEVEAIRPAVEASGMRMARIEAPGTVDGGDVCEAGDRLLVGVSDRTNEDGARQLARFAKEAGLETTFVRMTGVPGLLHLKTGLSWLGEGRLAVIGALVERPELGVFEKVVVEPEEEYAANCVLVNGRILVAEGYPRFANRLERVGLPVVRLGMSEFRKMDGGLSCLSLRY